MDRTQEPLLLTGATGLVGMELLARYLERTDRTIYALVRAADDREADARVRRTVSSIVREPSSYAGRVVPVPGDVTLPGLGLDARRRDELSEQIGETVHAAASVSFEQPLAEARAINVEGTRRLLELAERCQARRGLRRFSYVSTAYVAGTASGRFGEDDLDVGQGFRNPYERSEFEAELLVRSAMERLPVQVFRPSIIVGEQESGWTPSFNVIYWPLRAFSRGTYAVLPARRRAPCRRRLDRLRRRRDLRAVRPKHRRGGDLQARRRPARDVGRRAARPERRILPAAPAARPPAAPLRSPASPAARPPRAPRAPQPARAE